MFQFHCDLDEFVANPIYDLNLLILSFNLSNDEFPDCLGMVHFYSDSRTETVYIFNLIFGWLKTSVSVQLHSLLRFNNILLHIFTVNKIQFI